MVYPLKTSKNTFEVASFSRNPLNNIQIQIYTKMEHRAKKQIKITTTILFPAFQATERLI